MLEICLESSSGQLFQVVFIIFLVGFVIPFGMKRILEVLSGLEAIFAWKKEQEMLTSNPNGQLVRFVPSPAKFSLCFPNAS